MITPLPESPDKVLLLAYAMPSRVTEIVKLAAAVDDALEDRPDLAFLANLCLDELLTNIVQHGLQGVDDRRIHVRLSRSAAWLEIVIRDDAPPFDPFREAPVPDVTLALDERPIGGLGVHLVKSMMDEAHAYYDGSGNLIVLLKTLATDG